MQLLAILVRVFKENVILLHITVDTNDTSFTEYHISKAVTANRQSNVGN